VHCFDFAAVRTTPSKCQWTNHLTANATGLGMLHCNIPISAGTLADTFGKALLPSSLKRDLHEPGSAASPVQALNADTGRWTKTT
jgi:hypothetical protein